MSQENTNKDKYHLKLVERVNAGDAESVKELLSSSIEYSRSINNIDANGCTPLFYAAWMGREDLCQELINHGADLFKEVKSFRPIHVAASKNHANVVKLLIANGDSFYQSDIDRIQNSKKIRMKLSDEIIALASEELDATTSFSVNHAHGMPSASNQSRQGGKLDERRLERFMVAVSEGNMTRIKKYLSKKVVNVNDTIQQNTASPFFNMTALNVASKYNQHAAVVYLVKHGAQYIQVKRNPSSSQVVSSPNKLKHSVSEATVKDQNKGSISTESSQKQNSLFYMDLQQSINCIVDACEKSKLDNNEQHNHEEHRETRIQLNGYVSQLHEQVDRSLACLSLTAN